MGREVHEGGDIRKPKADSCLCMAEKPIQHCKAVILQLKKKKTLCWDFLGTQWLRIHLPMQGTQVWSLVWELRSYTPQSNWACALEPMLCNEKAPQWEACTVQLESNPDLPQPEKARARQQCTWALQQRPSAAKNKINKSIKSKTDKSSNFLKILLLLNTNPI